LISTIVGVIGYDSFRYFVNRKGEGRISPFLLSRVTDQGLGAIAGWRIARIGPQNLEIFTIEIINDGGPIRKLRGAEQNMFTLKPLCSKARFFVLTQRERFVTLTLLKTVLNVL
jgi:hypothetical protein